MATTISPFLAVFLFSTITISPSNIPAFIILHPLTFKVNTSLLFGTKNAGNVKNSFGFSIASIGLPAVIFPSNGTSTTDSFFGSNSFSTNNSKALFLLFCFLIYPFSSKFAKWAWMVAGLEEPTAVPISLIVGGYPCDTIYVFIKSKICFCFLVNSFKK